MPKEATSICGSAALLGSPYMGSNHYSRNCAPDFYEGNVRPKAMVDTTLPSRVQDLPQALYLPNWFLLASQFGPGPATGLRNAGPVWESQRMPQVPWPGKVSLETVWRFRQVKLGMVLSPEQRASRNAARRASMEKPGQTPISERAGMPIVGPLQNLCKSKSPSKQTGFVAAQQRAAT